MQIKLIRFFPLAAAQPSTILSWPEALDATRSRRARRMAISRSARSLLVPCVSSLDYGCERTYDALLGTRTNGEDTPTGNTMETVVSVTRSRNEAAPRLERLPSLTSPLLRLNGLCPYYTMFPLSFPFERAGESQNWGVGFRSLLRSWNDDPCSPAPWSAVGRYR